MEIREGQVDEAEKITEELWLPPAQEMEQISDYCNLKEDLNLDKVTEEKKDKISSEDGNIFVAELEDEYIGLVEFEIKESGQIFSRGKKLKINEIFVKEDYRENGIASALMDKTEEVANKNYCSTVELDVNKRNETAREFYESCGFEIERMRMIKKP
jgi:ribosomal protein S18 acetylase RimI-like enzyme